MASESETVTAAVAQTAENSDEDAPAPDGVPGAARDESNQSVPLEVIQSPLAEDCSKPTVESRLADLETTLEKVDTRISHLAKSIGRLVTEPRDQELEEFPTSVPVLFSQPDPYQTDPFEVDGKGAGYGPDRNRKRSPYRPRYRSPRRRLASSRSLSSVSSQASSTRSSRGARSRPRGGSQENQGPVAVAVEYPEIPGKRKSVPNVIPQERICNWEQFKNIFGNDVYAIDALLGEQSLHGDMDKEDAKRLATNYCSGDSVNRSLIVPPFMPGGPEYIQRVRINSRVVMLLLGKFTDAGEAWEGNPRTFIRPFRYLVHFQDRMEEELAKIKERVAAVTGAATTSAEGSVGKDVNEDSAPDTRGTNGKPSGDDEQSSNMLKFELPTADELRQEMEAKELDAFYSSESALNEVQCYVNFVRDYILQFSRSFDPDSANLPKKIRYIDLWNAIRLGDVLYVPPTSNDGTRDLARLQRANATHTFYRVYQLWIPTMALNNHEKASMTCTCLACRERTCHLTAKCYFLDFDGDRYGAREHELILRYYEGEKDITDLPFYPVRFMKDKEIYERAKLDGEEYFKHVSRRYGFYSGWTLLRGPSGEILTDSTGEEVKNPEHIESDVLVDFKEAFNAAPNWQPSHFHPKVRDYKHNTLDDQPPIMQWDDAKRQTLLATFEDITIRDDDIDTLEYNNFIVQDAFLINNRTPAPGPVDLPLLPRRMFAYSVGGRKWVHIDARYLKRMKHKGEESEAFDLLQMDEDNKDVIDSLVRAHLQTKEAERQGFEIETQDLIRGKGKGIIILLHGPPGVGKTATAESVAQKWRRPLFPITCGDLGFTAESVEKSLTEIFRLAHLWDCILLLDEADVFITQRDRHDLQRNALVSVFLRMLEYYNGILFLTTNRPGALDEAVKSRVHLHLRFNALNEAQTIAIFQINIKRLRDAEGQRAVAVGLEYEQLHIAEKEIEAFARKHYRTYSGRRGIGRWNGRQIRNAFLIASSLAHRDSEKTTGLQKQLRASHFERVDQVTKDYDVYRYKMLGDADDGLAGDRLDRSFQDEPEPEPTISVGQKTVQPARKSFRRPPPQQQQNAEQAGQRNPPRPLQTRRAAQPGGTNLGPPSGQERNLQRTEPQTGGQGRQGRFQGGRRPAPQPVQHEDEYHSSYENAAEDNDEDPAVDQGQYDYQDEEGQYDEEDYDDGYVDDGRQPYRVR